MELLVIVFDDGDAAHEARRALRELERQMFVAVEDAVVISRDLAGKAHMEAEREGDVRIGARAGALVGLLIGSSVPLLGLAVGAAGGALPASLAHRGLDEAFVHALQAELQPGSSALALLLADANPAALRAVLEPFRGRIIETRIDPELAERLRGVLK